MTTDLTTLQWETAHNIARELVLEDTDANEVGKANDYLCYYAKTGAQFFKYLQTLAKQGRSIGHSKKTSIYYENMADVCSKYLQNYQDNLEIIQQIMGWTFRLMRYYKEGVPIEELEELVANTEQTPILSDRQAEIAEAIASQKFAEGQEVEATVTNIKGNKVTYEIQGTIKLTQKEPKKYKQLKVRITVRSNFKSLTINRHYWSFNCCDAFQSIGSLLELNPLS